MFIVAVFARGFMRLVEWRLSKMRDLPYSQQPR
jgi:hypothetical protein